MSASSLPSKSVSIPAWILPLFKQMFEKPDFKGVADPYFGRDVR